MKKVIIFVPVWKIYCRIIENAWRNNNTIVNKLSKDLSEVKW